MAERGDTDMLFAAAKSARAPNTEERALLRVAHMFAPHRDDPLMRGLCRLAIRCAQGWPEGDGRV